MAGTIPTPSTIKKGSKGQVVKNGQGLLLAHGNDPKGIDGDYGPKTEAAAKAFQKAHSLVEDGIIGQNTWTKLLA